MSMKSIVFRRCGEPADVLELADVPIPEPGRNEVRVRMIASPINPSDLLYARGRYTFQPQFPAPSGFEGVGVVDQAGPGLLGRFLVGKRVFALNKNGGDWSEYAVVPANRAIPVPKDLPDEQVACFFVNPATAIAMVRHVLAVPRGDWLLQSAANSQLGKMIIRLCRHDGVKTLNVVRRRSSIAELKAQGADAVIAVEDGPIADQVRSIVGPQGVRFAIDPVGGEISSGVFESLADDGRMLVYGSLTGEALRISPRLLISGRRLEGFYLAYWMEARGIAKGLLLFRQIADLIRSGVLATEIGESFPLDRIADAARAAEQPGKSGKTLLKIGG